jgi:ABC-type glycerol-3-phosphate transport system substrate-binding protein
MERYAVNSRPTAQAGRHRQGPGGRRARRRGATALATASAAVAMVGFATPAYASQRASGSQETITVWQNGADSGLALTALQDEDAAFVKQYPQYKVDMVPIPFADSTAKFEAAIAAQSGPNIITPYPGVVAAAFKDGLVPLQSYLTASDRKNWLLLSSSVSPDGNTYAVPDTEYGYFIYYNKALFKKAGLNPDQPPQTWQQFVHDCSVLKAHGIVPLSGGFKDGYEWEWYAFPMLDQLMDKSVTQKWLSGDVPVTSAPFVTVWDMIKGLGTDGYFAPDAYALPLYNDLYTDFDSGKAAMAEDAPSVGDLTAAEKALGAANVGVFPFPRLAQSKWPPFVDTGPSNGLAITKWTKDKKAAWAYISYLESPAAQELGWKVAEEIPNNAQAKVTTSDPDIRTILTDLQNPLDHTVYTGFPLSVLAINEHYASEMVQGQDSTTNVLQMMEQLLKSLLPTLK